jgi:hypothetical protein
VNLYIGLPKAIITLPDLVHWTGWESMEVEYSCAPDAIHASNIQHVQFSEANGAWKEVPHWAEFLLNFGYRWPEIESAKRRIGLISMPCDSAAAGLIALGALRKRLEQSDADDLTSHFQRIQRLAIDRNHDLTLFDLRKRGRNKGPYVVDEFLSDTVWVRLVNGPSSRVSISLQTSVCWRFSEEPPVQVHSGSQVAFGAHYAALVNPKEKIRIENLSRSDSLICLAGRAVGALGTRDSLERVRFRVDGCIADLSELLTVQKWSPRTVSRISFFNTRTSDIDRNPRQPKLVIADGDISFLKVLEQNEFSDADVIGITHRTLERERLEAIGAKLAHLEQWYGRESESPDDLPPPPCGIAFTILKRR